MDLNGEKACVQMLSTHGLPEEFIVDLSAFTFGDSEAIALVNREEKVSDGGYETLGLEDIVGSDSNYALETEEVASEAQMTTEQLIDVFQHATTWIEIKEALALASEESKLEACNVLTPKEMQRVNQIITEAYGN